MSRKSMSRQLYSLCPLHGGPQTEDRVQPADVVDNISNWQLSEPKSRQPMVHKCSEYYVPTSDTYLCLCLVSNTTVNTAFEEMDLCKNHLVIEFFKLSEKSINSCESSLEL